MFVIVTIFVAIYIYAYFDKLELNEKKASITIYDVYGDVLYESNFKKNMRWIKIEEIPDKVKDAFISVEDKRFSSHVGFDPIRMVKALGNNVKNKGGIMEGGSTITQQYAKNLFLSNEQTISRKVEEFFYAARLEMQYSKDDILEGYLNTIYYGHGIYGIEGASQFFFDKELDQLSTAEIAMLVGIPNGPSIYSPYISMENAKNRQELILQVLYNNAEINKDQMETAKTEEIKLSTGENKDEFGNDEYYIDSVINELQNRDDLDLSSELHVYTYYDPNIQKQLSTAVHDQTNIEDDLQVSGVIIQPFTGNIMALSGGKDYTLSQYNRAINSQRQVASTIKPLLYYTALQQGFTPSSTFKSEPSTFKIDEKTTYSPTNYSQKYPNKDISMINAISLSDNIYAVKTHLFLGEDALSNALHDFGITQAKPDVSLALGTVNMSILEISKVYNTFASEGLYTQPGFISNITDEKGDIIYKREVKPKRLLDRDDTLILNQMLTSTYDSKNISHTVPTLIDTIPDIKVGGKSGTSEWDSLVVGFNPDYTIGVWCGYDDNRELEKKYYSVSKKIWQQTFNSLFEGKEGSWYQPSDRIVRKLVDPISGEEDKNGSEYWYLRTKEDLEKER